MNGNAPASGPPPPDETPARLAGTFAAALRRGNEDLALDVLRQSLVDGLDGPAIYLGVFQPAMDEIGALWETSQIGVGEVHRAASITRWLMDELLDEFRPVRRREGSPPLLAACAHHEYHDLGLTMVIRFLRRDGWRVADLGADVPESDYVETALQTKPGVCLLSAARVDLLPCVQRTIAGLHRAGVQVPTLVGGLLFRREPVLAWTVGATGTASDAQAVVAEVDRLVGH